MIELKTWHRAAIVAGALGMAVAGAVGSSAVASCAATPTSVPIQSFQRPQDVDVVCLNVLNANGQSVPPTPLPQSACAPVPLTDTDGGQTFPNHLYALVTQTATGEVALVDLTGEYVVDEDPGTPGINFLPVGTLPTDIASTPDGLISFVGSANPNAPAIYALPSNLILGDSQGLGNAKGENVVIPKLTTWPACALPQAPGEIIIAPTSYTSDVDDAGAPMASSGPGYVIVVVFPGNSSDGARIATIDPVPLMRGAGIITDAGPTIAPASLEACPILQSITLAAPSSATTWTAGQPWDDGVKYVDGGVDAEVPFSATACVATDAGPAPLFAGMVATPRAGAAAMDNGGATPILYVADSQLPIIHAIDLTNPNAPVELPPLLATSLATPSRAVQVGKIAVSPSTREFKRFLYAVDQLEGDVMVYDVTTPTSASSGPRPPMTRPHPELDPFQPPDRLIFSAPVAALSFVEHDWPLRETLDPTTGKLLTPRTALTGLLCNPNPSIDPNEKQRAAAAAAGFAADNGPFSDLGGNYRNNATVNPQPILEPQRLRGVFGIVTLSNGNLQAIDVDDWDSPCRRPDPMAGHGVSQQDGGLPVGTPVLSDSLDALLAGPTSGIAPPMALLNPNDPKDPYSSPFAFQTYDVSSPVTDEWFFPVSAPHRLRSLYLLRTDSVNGNHAPLLSATPQLYLTGSPIATQGDQSTQNPSMVPTYTTFVDPSLQNNGNVADPRQRLSTVTPYVLAFDGGISDTGQLGDGGNGGTIDAGNSEAGVPVSYAIAQIFPGSTPGVRFAWEDPIAHIDQNWVVTYEGELPGFYDQGGNPLVIADITAAADYSTLSLNSVGGAFCGKGIEDFSLASQRADSELGELAANGLPTIPNFDLKVGDYVQLTDNVLDSTDPYWQDVANPCWQELANEQVVIPPDQRAQVCANEYGQTLDPANPNLQRDFPILEAYDDHLVVGVFAYPTSSTAAQTTTNRQVVTASAANAKYLAQMQCCFHNQTHFNVRTGGQWSAVGSISGFLHHVVATAPDKRCMTACDARDALLNARSAPVPRPVAGTPTAQIACPVGNTPLIDRDSVLSMRNPMFSFLIWNGQDSATKCGDVPPVRDMAWEFTTLGQVTPMALNLAATTSGLSPQSMKFINSLGQLAVVDAESQGLILIDLGTFAEAHAPYF